MKQPLQILIVEDSEDEATLLELELERAGYDPFCHRVDSPEELAAALGKHKWDLIISDYDLKRTNFDGLKALELVCQKGIDIPFIIVSGIITDDKAVAAMKAGAHDY